MPSGLAGRPKTGRKLRAFITAKQGFNEDIECSLGMSNEFEILAASRRALKGFAAGILAPGIDDNHYLTNDPSLEASKLAYRAFLKDVWKHVQRIKPIDVVLSGNFGYYAERELASALEEEGTPFIVLHKENMKSPGRVSFFRSVYAQRRGAFGGRRILVYNDIERRLQIESGVAREDQVVVAGMPRLDRIHAWRQKHAGKIPQQPQVLFFSFWRKTGLPLLARKTTGASSKRYERIGGGFDSLTWEMLSRETHQAMIALARSRPEAKVIVKSKGRSREVEDTFAMLGGRNAALPPNLQVVVGDDPFELLTASSVVVGFNTTGLLEGLAAGKPVIVPWFGEISSPGAEDYVVDLGQAIEYAASPEALVEQIGHYLDNPVPVPARLSQPAAQALERWLGNADGRAGERIVAAVKRDIEMSAATIADHSAARVLETDS
jgi:glycosyltransferase involved in cell wall biosynthesis